MITFQMLPDILPSRVHVAIYLWFDSDSSALHVMVCCWIWQCTTALICLNDECLLINDDQNSGCQYDFNTALVLRGRSAVKCGRFQSTCMSQHSQWSEWQNTDCHRKLEPCLTVIFRHCVRRDPNNEIRHRSPIHSPAMLIKWLRYRHESSWSDSYALQWHTIQKVVPKLQRTLKAKTLLKSYIGHKSACIYELDAGL